MLNFSLQIEKTKAEVAVLKKELAEKRKKDGITVPTPDTQRRESL